MLDWANPEFDPVRTLWLSSPSHTGLEIVLCPSQCILGWFKAQNKSLPDYTKLINELLPKLSYKQNKNSARTIYHLLYGISCSFQTKNLKNKKQKILCIIYNIELVVVFKQKKLKYRSSCNKRPNQSSNSLFFFFW